LFLRDMRKDKVSWQSGIFLVLSFLAKPMWMFFFVPAAALIWIEHKKFQWRFYLKHLVVPVGIFLVYLLCHLPGILSNAAHSEIAAASLPLKIETVLYNYGNYFLRTFLPGNLFPLYPYYNPATDPRWMTLIPVVLLFTPLLARKKELRDAVIFGVLPVLVCFAVILIPVVGFIRVGNTDFADRYSYLPSLFLLAGAAFLLKLNIPKESAFGLWLPAMGILYCGGLLYKTELYLPVWKNPQSVTARSIALKTPNFSAVISTAHNRYLEKNFDGAIEICKEKLLEMPHYPPNFNRLIQIFKLALQGLILFQHNKPDEGIRYLNTIYMLPYSHLAFSLPVDFAQKIFTTGAEYHLKKYNDRAAAANLYRRCAVFFKLRSPLYTAFYSGMAALVEKNYAEAVKFFRIACELNPGEKRCQRNLKYALKALKEQKK
ncbi:MAG: hypothetical protein IKA87_01235, partial [Lentisphaeria bacterium]|nr:hypothetical protein [Lentisphaeria bacterium]